MKINKNRESHEYEQNLKKSWKWIKTGKVMKMNKISKVMKMSKSQKVMKMNKSQKVMDMNKISNSHEHQQNLKKSWKWIKERGKLQKVMNMNKIAKRHVHQQNLKMSWTSKILKKSWKWIKTGEISKSHEQLKNISTINDNHWTYLDEMRTVPWLNKISALSDKNWRIFRLLMIAAEQYLG